MLALTAGGAARAQEFTKQRVMLADLTPVGEAKVARRVADEARSGLTRMGNKREMEVLDPYFVTTALEQSSMPTDRPLAENELFDVARFLRVDEVVFGTVTAKANEVIVEAAIRLTRDWGQRQPLPLVRASTPAKAAEALAGEVTRARGQLTPLRRCENALRAGDRANAIRFAEEGVKAYAPSTFARTCLMVGLLSVGTRSDSVLHLADEILRLDAENLSAAVARAISLQAVNRQDDAERAWLRATELRADSVDLGVTAADALLQMSRAGTALDLTRRLSKLDERDARVRRLRFRAWFATSSWAEAAALGDSLDTGGDAEFREDSSYAVRYVDALRQSGDSIGALAVSARSVKRYPGDARIYSQYLRLIGSENVAALPRAIALFPSEPEFYVMAAKNARDAGKRREAIRATEAAVKSDPGLSVGYLQIADLWLEEQAPDSALAALRRAPRAGDGVDMLRSYAIARGVRLLRSAPDSALGQQRTAVNFLVFADSVASREDSRNYVAAGLLQLGRSELVLASKTRACSDLSQADTAVIGAAGAMQRGGGATAGPAAEGLKQAYDAMRAAVDNASKVLCKP